MSIVDILLQTPPPAGWHLPTTAKFEELEATVLASYVSSCTIYHGIVPGPSGRIQTMEDTQLDHKADSGVSCYEHLDS